MRTPNNRSLLLRLQPKCEAKERDRAILPVPFQ